VIIDTKRTIADFATGWGVVTSDPVAICYEPRVVWQPDLHTKRGVDDYERGLDLIYSVRGDPAGKPSVILLIDEAKHSAPTKPSPLLARIVFSGMGRGIATWALTQTRFNVYPNLFSDAVHVVAFRVQSAGDRVRLEQDIGVPSALLAKLGDHEYVYWRQGSADWSAPRKCKP
jgi:hypothetical protein